MDPGYVPARRVAAAALVQLGRFDEAVAQLALVPEARLDPVTLCSMGQALAAGGHRTRALSVLEKLRRVERTRWVSAYHLALLHAALGDIDAAIADLVRACDARDPWLDSMGVDPRLSALHPDARFAAVLDRVGIGTTPPAYWTSLP
jgi:tetratricopeptide (TPR) repeat protein